MDCFYEGENMLVIHPDECIDCGVCEPECPVDAIRPDTEPDMDKWVTFNREYLGKMAGYHHQERPAGRSRSVGDGVAGKMDTHFSPRSGRRRLIRIRPH